MVGLIDLAPRFETVILNGEPVTVPGISARGVAYLLGRFPELRKLISGQSIEADALMAMGGEAVGALLAAGCGYPGDDKAETIAMALPIDTQADLLAVIVRTTLPHGLGPFVEKLTTLGAILDAAPSDTAQASS